MTYLTEEEKYAKIGSCLNARRLDKKKEEPH